MSAARWLYTQRQPSGAKMRARKAKFLISRRRYSFAFSEGPVVETPEETQQGGHMLQFSQLCLCMLVQDFMLSFLSKATNKA